MPTPSIATVLQDLLGDAEAVAADDAAAWVATNSADILAQADKLELDAETEIVNAINEHLTVTTVFNLRSSVQNTVTTAGAQIVQDVGGAQPALLKAAETWLQTWAAQRAQTGGT